MPGARVPVGRDRIRPASQRAAARFIPRLLARQKFVERNGPVLRPDAARRAENRECRIRWECPPRSDGRSTAAGRTASASLSTAPSKSATCMPSVRSLFYLIGAVLVWTASIDRSREYKIQYQPRCHYALSAYNAARAKSGRGARLGRQQAWTEGESPATSTGRTSTRSYSSPPRPTAS